MIELRGVHKAFGDLTVLKDMDLLVPEGETFVILGRSGTGKSVMLKHIVGLHLPDAGQVLVDGVDVPSAGLAELRRIRREVAYLFQSGALVNWMTVRENVSLPLVERRELRRSAIDDEVDGVLDVLGMLAAHGRYPAEISGGMRKRAALARVLVQRPRAILYDEPTAGLDPVLARTVAKLIADVRAMERRTAIVVTHDLPLAFAVADRIGLHHEGRLVEVGTPDEFRKSGHALVRSFLDGTELVPQETAP